jgi:DedD protein
VNDILKQRLVGALILVALGVVFWPIIFVEPGDRTAVENSRIPPAPDIDRSTIEAPGPEGLRAAPEWESSEVLAEEAVDTGTEVQTEDPEAAFPVAEEPLAAPPVDSNPHTRSEAPVAPTLDGQGVPVAWMLQVASVSSAAAADKLRDRLLAMQEKAYVKKLHVNGKELYRVYIGPKIERAELEKIKSTVDKGFGVHSIIVRYVP